MDYTQFLLPQSLANYTYLVCVGGVGDTAKQTHNKKFKPRQHLPSGLMEKSICQVLIKYPGQKKAPAHSCCTNVLDFRKSKSKRWLCSVETRTTIKKICLIPRAIYLTRLSGVRLLTKSPVNNHIGFRHPMMLYQNIQSYPRASQGSWWPERTVSWPTIHFEPTNKGINRDLINQVNVNI